MYSLVLLAIISFLAALVCTPAVRSLFTRWGFVDQPGGRKTHKHPVPRVGGIAIAISYLAAFGVLFAVGSKVGLIVWAARASIWHLLPAAVAIFAVGLWDDLVGLKPWPKLAGQVVAAALAWSSGVRIHGFGGHQIADWYTFPITIGWLLLCTNAVNLIDGLDGLATGVGLFATLTTLIAALLQNNIELALATAPLAGALLGFLRFNFNPASIFLGDCGSLLIGFLLGCFGILWSQKSATLLGMTAPLMMLAIPLLDTALAIVRRFLRKQPIFSADHSHIHHRLLDRGLTPRRAVLVLYACCALGAGCALATMNHNLTGFIIIIFCLVTWIGIQHLGYVEFGTAGRLLVGGAFRRHLNAELALKGFESHLAAAITPQECWKVILDASNDFGFHDVRLQLAGRSFEQRNGLGRMQAWVIRIPISENEWIELTHAFGVLGPPSIIAPFAEILRKTLAPKPKPFGFPRIPG